MMLAMLNKIYGLLQITGEDAARFLQGQITNDIMRVTMSHHIFAAVSNTQGRVIATVRVFMVAQNTYIVLCARDLIATLQQHLKRYVLRARLVMHDVSEDYHIHGLSLQHAKAPLPKLAHAQQNFIADEHGFYLQHSIQTNDRWFYFSKNDAASVASFLIDSAAWQRETIKEKIPEIYCASTGLFTALSLNLLQLDAISLTKGCYNGQEIIARMHYLGKAKEALYAVTLQSDQCNLPCTGGQRVMLGAQQLGIMVNLCQQRHSVKGEGYMEGYIGLAVCNVAALQQQPLPLSVTLIDSTGVTHPCVMEQLYHL